MRLFKRRGHTENAPAQPVEPAVEEDPATLRQEAAEERQEFDDEVEVARNRRGLNPRWSLRTGDEEVTRREVRAAADIESDTAEKLFIKAEHDAEEHGGPGFPR